MTAGNPSMLQILSPGIQSTVGRKSSDGREQQAGASLSWAFDKIPVTAPDQREGVAEAMRTLTLPVRQPVLQRKCAACEMEDERGPEPLRRKENSPDAGPRSLPGIVAEALRSPGEALDPATRASMEQQFQYDFGRVRVHSGAKAAASARAVKALAYTVGNDIVFGSGQYLPRSDPGKQLLAHELAHVLQQSAGATANRGISRALAVGDANDPLEKQADDWASRVLSGAVVGGAPCTLSQSGPAPMIQRQVARPRPRISRSAPIVADGQKAAPGQMQKSEFLTEVREALMRELEPEFAPLGRTARDCPYIVRTIDRYAGRPVSALMRLIESFAHPSAGADANELIRAVTRRARDAARRIAEKSGDRVQAMTRSSDVNLPGHDPVTVRSQLSSGRAFDGSIRRRMEQSFGRSFAAVRIHDDAAAARLNRALGARAFTVGHDIAFGTGEYRPGTAAGDVLIAHELAHTIQQEGREPGSRPRDAAFAAGDGDLERQADWVAAASPDRRKDAVAALRGTAGKRIQRLPAVVAGGLILAEATPEIVIAAEVGSEVLVVEGSLTVAAEVAAPTIVEAAAPTVLETIAPTALEAAAPTALEATAASSSSAVSSATAATTAAITATTLSSDSPTQEQEEDRRRRDCRSQPGHQFALDCGEEIPMEEQVQEFLLRQGYGYEALGECTGFDSHAEGVISECSGAPGESFHCEVAPDFDPIARVSRPGGVISIFSCLCCRADGSTGFEWRGAHWSPGAR
jgi:hypothetical protein